MLTSKRKRSAERAMTAPGLFPLIGDGNFSASLARLSQFKRMRYDIFAADRAAEKDGEKNEFHLAPNQLFLRSFLSVDTPYRSIYMYHGMGEGKTCSALAVAEDFRKQQHAMGIRPDGPHVFIVGAKMVLENFEKEFSDVSKLHEKGGKWYFNTCVGNDLLDEIPMTEGILLRGAPDASSSESIRTTVRLAIKAIFERSYKLLTSSDLQKKIQDVQKRDLQEAFNDTLLIADEAHNLVTNELMKTIRKEGKAQVKKDAADAASARMLDEWDEDDLVDLDPNDDDSDEEPLDNADERIEKIRRDWRKVHFIPAKKDSKPLECLMLLALHVQRMRFAFLSGTPVSLFPTDILPIVNVMRVNDGLPPVLEREIFNKASSSSKKGIMYTDATQSVFVKNTGEAAFREAIRGYFSYVGGRNPHQFPAHIPSSLFMPKDTFFSNKEDGTPFPEYFPSEPTKEVRRPKIIMTAAETDAFPQLCLSKISDNHLQKYQEYVNNYNRTRGFNDRPNEVPMVQWIGMMELLGMYYPNVLHDVHKSFGYNGFVTFFGLERATVIDGKRRKNDALRLAQNGISYPGPLTSPEDRIFMLTEIGKYSPKLKRLGECLLLSRGIVIIYCFHIPGMLIPCTLMLEEMGFKNFDGKQLLTDTDETPMLDYETMQPTTDASRAAKYTFVESVSDSELSKHKDNINGERCKCFLIKKNSSEGMDYANVTGIHLMEGWFNMNRVDQTIGRAIRKNSSRALPPARQNVEVYLHATDIGNRIFSADSFVYLEAIRHSLKAGVVTRILKEESVDLYLNSDQVDLIAGRIKMDKRKRDMELSTRDPTNPESGIVLRDFRHGHQPFSGVCDYQQNCDYFGKKRRRLSETERAEEDVSGFGTNTLRRNYSSILARVRSAFRVQPAYRFDDLMAAIQRPTVFLRDEILDALGAAIETGETLVDKHGRQGTLVTRRDLYLFQPAEAPNSIAGVFERDTAAFPNRSAVRLYAEEVERNFLDSVKFWKEILSIKEQIKAQKLASGVVDHSFSKLSTYIGEANKIRNAVIIYQNQDRPPGVSTYDALVGINWSDWTADDVTFCAISHILDTVDKHYRVQFLRNFVLDVNRTSAERDLPEDDELLRILLRYREAHRTNNAYYFLADKYVEMRTETGNIDKDKHIKHATQIPSTFKQKILIGVNTRASGGILLNRFRLAEDNKYMPREMASLEAKETLKFMEKVFPGDGAKKIGPITAKSRAFILEMVARLNKLPKDLAFVRPDQTKNMKFARAERGKKKAGR